MFSIFSQKLAGSIEAAARMEVISPAFANKGEIPVKYTPDGANVNPALIINHVPRETQSLALIVEALESPVDGWVHWLVWNIHPSTKINEDSIPGIEGLNSFYRHHYTGPCPYKGFESYVFKVYALDTLLLLHDDSTHYEIEKLIRGHILGYGEITGFYERREYRILKEKGILNTQPESASREDNNAGGFHG